MKRKRTLRERAERYWTYPLCEVCAQPATHLTTVYETDEWHCYRCGGFEDANMGGSRAG
jgi:hypothetical protein